MAPNYALRRTVALTGLVAAVWGVHATATALIGLVTPDGPAPNRAAALGVPAAAPAAAPAPRERITGTDPITLSFAGDTHFEKQLAAAATRPDGLAALQPHLAAADLTVVNLETAITASGKPLGGKQFTFAAPPSALATLAGAGVDVVSLANNHAVDFGADGLAETLAARAGAPVAMVGIGADEAEAFTPSVHVIDGVSVAVLAATQLKDHTTHYFTAGAEEPGVASMVSLDRLERAVRDAAAAHDVVVVVPHWGTEKELCPTPAQFEATRVLTAAGADIIVGSHSHRVMAGGWSGNSYVGYGLGNFVWFLNTTFPGRSTGVLTLEVDKEKVAQRRAAVPGERASVGALVTRESWQPLIIPDSGIPTADPATARTMIANRAALLGCSKLAGAPDAPGAAVTASAPATATPTPEPPAPAASASPAEQPFEAKGVPIVSRDHPLASSYVPPWSKEADGLHPDVRAAVDRMIADARAAGMPLAVRSGYRDWATQDASFKRAWARYGEGARRYYAEAGHSEHQTGLALDLSADGKHQKGHQFARTPQAAWVAQNAHRYGFVIRYPEGKRHITGVDHEPWHVRWVGVELATELAARPGLTLEEYLGLA